MQGRMVGQNLAGRNCQDTIEGITDECFSTRALSPSGQASANATMVPWLILPVCACALHPLRQGIFTSAMPAPPCLTGFLPDKTEGR